MLTVERVNLAFLGNHRGNGCDRKVSLAVIIDERVEGSPVGRWPTRPPSSARPARAQRSATMVAIWAPSARSGTDPNAWLRIRPARSISTVVGVPCIW